MMLREPTMVNIISNYFYNYFLGKHVSAFIEKLMEIQKD